MKLRKSLLATLLLLAAAAVSGRVLQIILAMNGLALRATVRIVAYSLLMVLAAAVFAQIVAVFCFWLRGKEKGTFLRMVGAAITMVAILSVLSGGIWAGSKVIFSTEREHVVEKNGTKMVACVNNFLQVVVQYYDYDSMFVRGNQVRAAEDYGNAEYDDPFVLPDMPEPRRAIDFDQDGQMILPHPKRPVAKSEK